MRNSIAVMNTKGGVGKSTLVLALAETISAYHGKNVLVIDSDAQASVSSMLMSVSSLYKLQSEGATIVDYLHGRVLKGQTIDWPKFIVRNVSDVDDARSLFLLPSDMQLTLLEREVSKENLHARLREVIGELLTGVRRVFDVVLIDCPAGLSVLTECWLREAAFYISPTRPDYISTRGLAFMRKFRQRNPEMGFAELLGVIVNMKDPQSSEDDQYDQWLRQDPDNRCFSRPILRVTPLQSAAYFSPSDRSYWAKYPGQTGDQLRHLTDEFLHRVSGVQNGQSSQRR